MHELTIYRRVMCDDTEEWFVLSNVTWGVWQVLNWALKSLKICNLIGSFWPKFMLLLKKYKRVFFRDNEQSCKIWRKTYWWWWRLIVFVVWLTGKTYFQSGPLSEILTISNPRHAASRIWTCAEREFRLCWMKLCSSDNHYTTTCAPKIDIRNLTNFYQSTR